MARHVSNRPFDTEDAAATPLTPDERAQLIPTYLTTRAQLNLLEQQNISEADFWAFSRSRNKLDREFLRLLHRRMFRRVWKWAGAFRRTARNIGVDAFRIDIELGLLLEDAKYWVAHQTFDPDEIAVQFHHRLVFIHPSPNGNGRHARLAADLLAVRLGRPRFTWGRVTMDDLQATRAAYIRALKAADGFDIAPLLAFARA